MKINKIIIRIAHFFGKRLKEEHIDDVTVNILDASWHHDFTKAEVDDLSGLTSSGKDKTPDHVVDKLKEKAYDMFIRNPRLEKRCRNAHQLWVTFRLPSDDIRSGSLMKMMMYDNGILYYQCDRDIKLYEEAKKAIFGNGWTLKTQSI